MDAPTDNDRYEDPGQKETQTEMPSNTSEVLHITVFRFAQKSQSEKQHVMSVESHNV